MKQKRSNVEQIVAVLKQAEAGVPLAEREQIDRGSQFKAVPLERSACRSEAKWCT